MARIANPSPAVGSTSWGASAQQLWGEHESLFGTSPPDSTTRKQIRTNLSIITSGPYALDPNRAPADALIAPVGPVLSHVGNRWTGMTSGVASAQPMQYASGSMGCTWPGTAAADTPKFDATGLFGKSIKIVTSATDATLTQGVFQLAAGVAEQASSVICRLPRPTVASTYPNVMNMQLSDGTYVGVWKVTQSVTGKYKLACDINVNGTWGTKWTSGDISDLATIKIAWATQINSTASTSKVKFQVFTVTAGGAETPLAGATEITGLAWEGKTYLKTVFGKLSGDTGYASVSIYLDAVRCASGSGAYNARFLTAQTAYPDPR